MEVNNKFKKSNYNSFSLDRIDSNKGHEVGNVQIISNKANRSKSNATIEEYEKIVNNLENLKINKDYSYKSNINKIKKDILKKCKARVKKYNLDFNLDENYLELIYPKNNKCPLLNIELKKGNGRPVNSSPTLDRIISKLGYVKGNVVFISHKANIIKNNLTLEEMKVLLNNWKNII
jgi:hypothetical protein